MKTIITVFCMVCGVIFAIKDHAELAAIYNSAALVIIALGSRPPRNA